VAEDHETAVAVDEEPKMATTTVTTGLRYVARQPILDWRGNLHGYEILFRAGPTKSFSGDGDLATRNVLDNLVSGGIERLSGGAPLFVNCTQEALLDGLVRVLPTDVTVLELLETLEPTADLLAACIHLKTEGYRLALDDFEWRPEWEPFMGLADYVKMDISSTTPQQRLEMIQRLRKRKSTAVFVAERVETLADLAMARKEGFTLFQGYYFCRPVLLQSREIPANVLVHLQVLKALHEEPLDTRVVSALVKGDAALTYRLLRVVNSPTYGLRKVVTSIHGALVLVGDDMFRRVATLAITCGLKGQHPSELLRMALVRGRFCELAAAVTGQDATEQYLLGILSLMPVMLGVPTEEIANAMPLRPEVQRALLGENNSDRLLLQLLTYYELGFWERCDKMVEDAAVVDLPMADLYKQALEWAEQIMELANN
jgi:EAL and modified HD-GYP domain-containing signal transduction protein